MSLGALAGLVLVAVAAVLWTRATLALARANPSQRVLGRRDRQWWHWWKSYCFGFLCGLMGCSQLKDAYGWWGYLAGFAVFLLPPMIIAQEDNQGLPRNAPPA